MQPGIPRTIQRRRPHPRQWSNPHHPGLQGRMGRSGSARSKENTIMNNLHRELAPISDAAWADIEEEATRTFKRYLAGRRVVDVHGPGGVGLSAIGTGHLKTIAEPDAGILARQRDGKPL